MKILTITCHNCMNYGASLQAYALLTFIKQNGYDCEIIDYMPKGDMDRVKLTRLNKAHKCYCLYNLLGPFKGLFALYLNRKQWPFRKRIASFNYFTQKFLKVTDRRFYSYEDLVKHCPKADLYIVGSDQVWNTDMQNGRDPSFYLSFVKDCSKCISYAASFGLSEVREKYLDFVRKSLGHLRWISVREATGVKIVNSFGYASEQVLDPVFLLDKEHWDGISNDIVIDKFLLLYHLGPFSSVEKEVCLRIAKEKQLKIISINSKMKIDFADININDAGPIEFLQYIKSASFVVSTSFHATAFSVIFNKQFVVCPIIGQDNVSRMKDFLGLLSLEKQLIVDSHDDISIIDYNKTNEVLSGRIKSSKETFVKQILWNK